MKTKTHDLKTNPEIFDLVKKGIKTFEYRKNDRDFKIGDFVRLGRWEQKGFSEILPYRLEITYILYGGQFGIPSGFCIFSWCKHDLV